MKNLLKNLFLGVALLVGGCGMREGVVSGKGYFVDPNDKKISTCSGNRYVSAGLMGLRIAQEIGQKTPLVRTYTTFRGRQGIDYLDSVVSESVYDQCKPGKTYIVPVSSEEIFKRLAEDAAEMQKRFPND